MTVTLWKSSALWEAVKIHISKEKWENALEDRHGKELQNRFSSAVVAVCGLGGLGSNIVISLARSGIGRLILIDFDKVDIANLNRQQYKASQIGMYKTQAMAENIAEISPYTEVKIHTEKLCTENAYNLLSSADIICEAFDNADTKAVLANYVLEHFPEKYLICASGMAGLGSANAIKTKRISSKFYLCGDGESDVAENGTLFSSRAMLCAAHQTHTVLRILAGKYDA